MDVTVFFLFIIHFFIIRLYFPFSNKKKRTFCVIITRFLHKIFNQGALILLV